MNEVFEKIIEKLKDWTFNADVIMPNEERLNNRQLIASENAIEIVNQEAEQYDNGWISCSDRLPEEAFGCLVTVIDCNPVTLTEFENILPYVVCYDGDGWNDADGETIPFEVLAWKKLPAPYQPKGE